MLKNATTTFNPSTNKLTIEIDLSKNLGLTKSLRAQKIAESEFWHKVEEVPGLSFMLTVVRSLKGAAEGK